MHFFHRPPCPSHLLAPMLQKKVVNWSDYFKKYPQEHADLSTLLWCTAQEFFCAYCERVIESREGTECGDGHIEHRERISDNPSRMGDWTNLFFSCNDPTSCGRYKDEQAGKFDIADIVDPSIEDPLDYLRYDANGGVGPIESDSAHLHKAAETIRVFNLDKSPSLRALRKSIAATVAAFVESCGGTVTAQERADFLESVKSQDCPSVYKSLLRG